MASMARVIILNVMLYKSRWKLISMFSKVGDSWTLYNLSLFKVHIKSYTQYLEAHKDSL